MIASAKAGCGHPSNFYTARRSRWRQPGRRCGAIALAEGAIALAEGAIALAGGPETMADLQISVPQTLISTKRPDRRQIGGPRTFICLRYPRNGAISAE
ncbi:hypothetical protein [Alicyclobacillus acidiphilus]|uniref:hypothetical protein n=1 Tax=Alicyclobacillus acidiphilus TaxID=182455 RepID=UPI00082DB484|nr:hypothetical protein [Alicyclobacillus acidiphilus]